MIVTGKLHYRSTSGALGELIDAIIVSIVSIFTSAMLHDELRVLSAPEMLAEYARLSVVISPSPLPAPVAVDPDGDAVLAYPIATEATLIFSGDDNLLR